MWKIEYLLITIGLMDIIELCFINGIQGRRRTRALAIERGTLKSWPESVEGMFWGRRRSKALATERGFAGKVCLFCKNLVSFVLQRPIRSSTQV
jgi:hypothetical protein